MNRSVPGRLHSQQRHIQPSYGRTRWGIERRVGSWRRRRQTLTSDPVREDPPPPTTRLTVSPHFTINRKSRYSKESVHRWRQMSDGRDRADCTILKSGGGVPRVCCCSLNTSITSPRRHSLPTEALYKFKFAQLVNGTCCISVRRLQRLE